MWLLYDNMWKGTRAIDASAKAKSGGVTTPATYFWNVLFKLINMTLLLKTWSLICSYFSIDAKLGKRCTLLDLSRRPSLVASRAHDSPASSSETKDQDSTGLSRKPAEDAESTERMEQEENEEPEEKKPTGSPVKMEGDPTDSASKEQSIV